MNLIEILLQWYALHGRKLPWRATNDPYKIWLSEVILQQTRVDQGLPYYLRFIDRYPQIEDLAQAPEQEVYKLWEGLGYYNRCKNMLRTARLLNEQDEGHFPQSYEALLKLPGIGPYTAAAIASIAFGEAQIALDGNLKRVFSRLFGIYHEIHSRDFLKSVEEMGTEWITERPGDINQAFMDLSSQICKPRNPDCESCPIRGHCHAYGKQVQKQLPIKKSAPTKQNKQLLYQLHRKDDKVLLHQRSSSGIWPNLYEFSPIDKRPSKGQKPLFSTRHQLSHQVLDIQVYPDISSDNIPEDGLWVALDSLEQYALPRPLHALRRLLLDQDDASEK